MQEETQREAFSFSDTLSLGEWLQKQCILPRQKNFIVFLLEDSRAWQICEQPTCGQGHDTAYSGCNSYGEIAHLPR